MDTPNPSEILADQAAVYAKRHGVKLSEAQTACLAASPALRRFYLAWKRDPKAQPALSDEAEIRALVLTETPTEAGKILRIAKTQGIDRATARRRVIADRGVGDIAGLGRLDLQERT